MSVLRLLFTLQNAAFFKEIDPALFLIGFYFDAVTVALLGLPLFLVNARLSERSARRVGLFGRAGRALFQAFAGILAQTEFDAQRYRSLGVRNVVITGNLKFDVPLDPRLIARGKEWQETLQTNQRLMVCAASTRDGEEEIIMNAWLDVIQSHPELARTARLIVVPRHPQRFDEVCQILQKSVPLVVRKSELVDALVFAKALNNQTVILGDSMGEMSFYYALSDLVVMGGSLRPLGGQNFIEACSLGCPAILGQHTFNFQQASQDVIDAHAAIRVSNVEELSKAMSLLLLDKNLRETMSANAIDFSGQHMGATGKIMDIVHQYPS